MAQPPSQPPKFPPPPKGNPFDLPKPPSPAPSQPDGSTTRGVLAALEEKRRMQSASAKPEVNRPSVVAGQRAEDHDEHLPHVDERWLVSYADMMTLLFGLFVMLYSMADKFEKVQQSASGSFNSEKPVLVAPPPPPPPPAADPVELRKQVDDARAQLTAVRQQAQQELQLAQKRIEELEKQVIKPTVTAPDPTIALRKRIEQQDQEKAEIARKLTESEAVVAKLAQPVPAAKAAEDLRPKLAKVEAALAVQKKAAEDLRKEVIKRDERIAKLEDELKNTEKKNPTNSFAAVVINWSSKDHDIDLVVEDPEGRVYDFKHRTYPGKPGNLALDTRRGPGTEVWQSDATLPGIYKVTYIFYNQYGNTDPAPVSGTVFTPKGSLTLPAQTLQVGGAKARATLKFSIDAAGKASLVP